MSTRPCRQTATPSRLSRNLVDKRRAVAFVNKPCRQTRAAAGVCLQGFCQTRLRVVCLQGYVAPRRAVAFVNKFCSQTRRRRVCLQGFCHDKRAPSFVYKVCWQTRDGARLSTRSLYPNATASRLSTRFLAKSDGVAFVYKVCSQTRDGSGLSKTL